jgi:hypothetical protein
MVLVESVLLYGSEIWTLKNYYRKILQAVEMDYLRRSARVSRLEHVSNQEIRTRMNAEESIIDRIKNKGLNWFGHLLKMEVDRWPKQLYQWKPPGKRKRGRPNKSWREEMMTAMQSRRLNIEDAQDRRLWRIRTGRRH